jgi:uncharacterized protein YndB with AHSA1/START domain
MATRTGARRRGVQAVRDELATLTFERRYPHTIAHVWAALTTPEGLRGWLLCTEASIEARVGGRIELVSGPAQYRSTGLILEWEPPHRFTYEWNVAPVPEMPAGERAVFHFVLTAEDDGRATRLDVVYDRITRQTARGFLPGLHAFLDRLEAQLDGAPLPDWFERFQALRAEYPEWTGHAPPAGE